MEQTMLEAMMSRKSVRSYTDQMVSDADIEKVLKAGQYAATAEVGWQRSLLSSRIGRFGMNFPR